MKFNPVLPPSRGSRRFVIHAIQHVAVVETVSKQLVDVALLVVADAVVLGLILFECWNRMEKRLDVARRMVVGVALGQAGFVGRVVDVVLRDCRGGLPQFFCWVWSE